ncbi:MAG TPA: RNA polymerase sigma factor [Bacteroidales bacterium]|jgi:RNA polymerase sigma-70 factor (ECF subfamily)|nr:RNA polymerase sigma factor [Bacteroidales bacterium]
MINDDEILKGCCNNKHKYQMALFDKYAPMMRGVCLRYVRNDADADDLLQEGFIKILDNIRNYVETGSFKAWIKRIMVNQAINFLKKKNQHEFYQLNENVDFDEKEQDYNQDKTENRLIDANIGPDEILKLIKDLPEGYQMVLNMYVIDGFSHKEIAEQLNISIGTSKSQLSRARKTLLDKANGLILKNTNSYEQEYK